jgi:uncharacterized protein YcbX
MSPTTASLSLDGRFCCPPDAEQHIPTDVRIAELWRYPVKSLQGESLQRAELTGDGLGGDRRFALFDVETGFGLTGRRQPELMFASGRLIGASITQRVA